MKIENKNIIVIGDIHGCFGTLKDLISEYSIEDSILIQVGDFGIGFNENEDEILEDLSDFLLHKHLILYVIRGNHDMKLRFSTERLDRYSNLKLLPDYTVLENDTMKILLVGGATSIDRKKRKESIDYWSDEKFVLDIEKIKSFEGITHLITHNAPKEVTPIKINDLVLSYARYDSTLIQELIIERNNISIMLNILKEKNKIKSHYYGHFHFSNIEVIDDIKHILLNINEFKEIND